MNRITLIDLLFLLAPVLVVPIGLRLVALTDPVAVRVLRGVRLLLPVGASAAVASFVIPVGRTAALVAGGWLAVCALAGLAGLIGFARQRSVAPRLLVPQVALAYLTVGGLWLVIARSGIAVPGIPRPIPELTAVHFHYAGFAASTLASLVVVRLSGVRRWRLLAAATSLLVVAGSPIVASGFVSGIRPLLALGAVLIAVGLIGTAALTFFLVVPAMERRSARWLLRLSSVSVFLPMVLAVQWSAGPLFRIPTLDIEAMAAIHGDLNALGFTLPGLLGWTIEMAGRRKGAAGGSLRAHVQPSAAS